jgi:2,3-bisphosphoglycerate-dependent phosphoglycerate mutase
VTELIVIRHGETDWNRQQRFQGQIDVPLNPLGLAQAAALGRRAGDADLQADAFFSSDLQRARQTAAPLATAWGSQPVLLQGLREQHFGEWEGLDAPSIRARWPAEWARWLEHRADEAAPGGETPRQFHARVLATLRKLAEAAAPRQRLVIVSHGGVLDMLWRTARGEPLDGLRRCDIPNAGINRLRWITGPGTGTLEIDDWADASHLEGLPPPLRP